MTHYLITLKKMSSSGEGDINFWLPVGKNGKKKRFKPEPIKLNWWARIKTWV